MSKKFLSYFLIGGAFVAAAVLWLLNVLEVIDWFSLSAAVALLSGVAGVVFILTGLFGKTKALPLKKLYIYFGAGLLIVTLFALINIFAIRSDIVLPVIAIIVVAALLLGMIAVGGKKWDSGDNQKVGYKNYYERKAEEEKKNKDKED
jgi:xanthosine utilization system XapX-like protein